MVVSPAGLMSGGLFVADGFRQGAPACPTGVIPVCGFNGSFRTSQHSRWGRIPRHCHYGVVGHSSTDLDAAAVRAGTGMSSHLVRKARSTA